MKKFIKLLPFLSVLYLSLISCSIFNEKQTIESFTESFLTKMQLKELPEVMLQTLDLSKKDAALSFKVIEIQKHTIISDPLTIKTIRNINTLPYYHNVILRNANDKIIVLRVQVTQNENEIEDYKFLSLSKGHKLPKDKLPPTIDCGFYWLGSMGNTGDPVLENWKTGIRNPGVYIELLQIAENLFIKTSVNQWKQITFHQENTYLTHLPKTIFTDEELMRNLIK